MSQNYVQNVKIVRIIALPCTLHGKKVFDAEKACPGHKNLVESDLDK